MAKNENVPPAVCGQVFYASIYPVRGAPVTGRQVGDDMENLHGRPGAPEVGPRPPGVLINAPAFSGAAIAKLRIRL